MKLTNKTGLPKTVERLCEMWMNNHPLMDEDTISVTESLKSVRQIVLKRRHYDEIEVDCNDMLEIIFGTIMHYGLEQAGKSLIEAGEDLVTETRFELDLGDGYRLSGGFDLYDKETRTLIDYKNCKVYKYDDNVKGKDDAFARQLYLYSLGIEKLYGEKPANYEVVVLIRDHSKKKAGLDSSYPQHSMMMIKWNNSDLEAFRDSIDVAKEKIIEVKKLLESGNEPPLCTFSDCFCTEDWAIRKDGVKRADKKFDSPDEAIEFYESLPADKRNERRIYHRVSDFKNCREYCECADFCSQWQENKDFEAFEEDVTDELESGYIPF